MGADGGQERKKEREKKGERESKGFQYINLKGEEKEGGG